MCGPFGFQIDVLCGQITTMTLWSQSTERRVWILNLRKLAKCPKTKHKIVECYTNTMSSSKTWACVCL